jgi:hypothetical protein
MLLTFVLNVQAIITACSVLLAHASVRPCAQCRACTFCEVCCPVRQWMADKRCAAGCAKPLTTVICWRIPYIW